MAINYRLHIDLLIDVSNEDPVMKINRYISYIRMIYPPTDPEIMYLMAKIMAKLIISGGRLCSEFRDFEIARSLQWILCNIFAFILAERGNRRLMGLIFIRQLMVLVPNMVSNHITQILSIIWEPFKDPHVIHLIRDFA